MYADGASRGNPGPAAIGAIVLDESGRELARISEAIGLTTNNQAEYRAAIAALEMAGRFNPTEAILYLDSQLVANQLNGKYRVKNASLQPLYAEAIKQINRIKKITVVHVPREENEIANALASAALRGHKI